MIVFPPFRLNPLEQKLWCGGVLVHLKPMAFAVLRYLLDHPGQLVTRKDLLARFWSDVHIGEGVLNTQIGEIRQALGDRAKEPRFIETVHRHGYRFIGRVESPTRPDEVALKAFSSPKATRARPPSHAAHVVGRQTELDVLTACWAKARGGERQVVFVTGEAGIASPCW